MPHENGFGQNILVPVPNETRYTGSVTKTPGSQRLSWKTPQQGTLSALIACPRPQPLVFVSVGARLAWRNYLVPLEGPHLQLSRRRSCWLLLRDLPHVLLFSRSREAGCPLTLIGKRASASLVQFVHASPIYPGHTTRGGLQIRTHAGLPDKYQGTLFRLSRCSRASLEKDASVLPVTVSLQCETSWVAAARPRASPRRAAQDYCCTCVTACRGQRPRHLEFLPHRRTALCASVLLSQCELCRA